VSDAAHSPAAHDAARRAEEKAKAIEEEEEEAEGYHLGIMIYKRVHGENDILARRAIESDPTGWWRRAMVRVTDAIMRYQHVEVVFPMGRAMAHVKDPVRLREARAAREQGRRERVAHVYAYGVTGGSTVFGKPRAFSSPNYDYVAIMVGPEMMRRAIQFCEAQVGKPSDDTGALRSVSVPKVTDYASFYCVELAVACLQQLGIMRGVPPSAVTIDELHSVMAAHPARLKTLSPFTITVIDQNEALPHVSSSSSSSSSLGTQPPTDMATYNRSFAQHMANALRGFVSSAPAPRKGRSAEAEALCSAV
jgi:hypothetical protein